VKRFFERVRWMRDAGCARRDGKNERFTEPERWLLGTPAGALLDGLEILLALALLALDRGGRRGGDNTCTRNVERAPGAPGGSADPG
jgi:hypothetical protein